MSAQSTVVDGLSASGAVSMSFAIDPAEAQRKLISIRKRVYDDSAVVTNEIVENPARTAAAHISGDEDSWFHAQYANQVTGLNLTLTGTDSLDSTKQFLTRAGLLA
ncbi:hypothetical protein C3V38_05805 [Dietzia sp. oral taxon 368]|uniref:hypothetical protein n=1 Tax=Dietzia sp. oral taxon 368 TaxID=712270 RepID=UPI000D0949C4|nr:hypothetical protein [Dietzia sp. oral taxon 368]AVM63988.1 hypothetical protein C3V38_05805 [Dietzia sp. oral taxon 368]